MKWHAGARTWTPQSHPRERLAAQRRAASDEEVDVDRDPRARPAPGRAGLYGIPARRRRRWSLSAVWTPAWAEDLRVEPFSTSCNNGVSKALMAISTLPFQISLSNPNLTTPTCGRYTPARALRMAPGCAGTLCAGVTHGPGGRSLRGRYAWPRGCCNCVYLLCGTSAVLALHKTPHCPTAQAVSQTHAPASRSGRPPCAQTAMHQGWARRGLGGLRTAHSYTQCTAQPHPDTHPADIQPEIHRPPGSQADQDTGSLGPDWETSPYGCDVPL